MSFRCCLDILYTKNFAKWSNFDLGMTFIWNCYHDNKNKPPLMFFMNQPVWRKQNQQKGIRLSIHHASQESYFPLLQPIPKRNHQKLGYPKCLKKKKQRHLCPFFLRTASLHDSQRKSIEVQIDGLKLITLDHQPGENPGCLGYRGVYYPK